jgi:DNA polymerase elongation subunit (family B)
MKNDYKLNIPFHKKGKKAETINLKELKLSINDDEAKLQAIKNEINKIFSAIENSDKSDCRVKTIQEISYTGYVYDLTTDNHHFAAGIGNMIVHNTDSVFFTFNLQTPEGKPIRGKEALEITIELAQEAGHLASSFLKGPHDLEYEKTFMPFCLLSKKRYVGMLYETDPNKCKRKEMGIVLKRRDNAPIVKDIYGGIIDILMKEKNIQNAIIRNVDLGLYKNNPYCYKHKYNNTELHYQGTYELDFLNNFYETTYWAW